MEQFVLSFDSCVIESERGNRWITAAEIVYAKWKEVPNKKLFADACKELWIHITPEKWGRSQVPQYFFRILHDERFYPNAYCS